MFAKDTSKKIRATLQNKGRSGERISAIPPYGYRKDPNDNQKWIVDEEAAVVVQKIFALCLEGLGPTHIANWLKENKILTPSAYSYEKGLPIRRKQKSSANPYNWSSRTIAEMLARIEYLGHTANFKRTKVSFKSKKQVVNDPSQWVIIEGTQEPIIDENIFLLVQKIRQGKRRHTKLGEMNMFSGLLFCADCGSKMTLYRNARQKPGQEYFICSTYRKDSSQCSIHTIRHRVLEEIITQNLKEAIAYVNNYEDEFIQNVTEYRQNDQNKELNKMQTLLAYSEQRVTELDVLFQRLYEDNIMGKISDERFIKMSQSYENEQAQLKAQINTLTQEIQQRQKNKTDVQKFIKLVKRYINMTELNSSILREFVEKVYISAYTAEQRAGKQERKITIVYNFIGAFDFMYARNSITNE